MCATLRDMVRYKHDNITSKQDKQLKRGQGMAPCGPSLLGFIPLNRDRIALWNLTFFPAL